MIDNLEFDPDWCAGLVTAALREDVGPGDVTSQTVLPPALDVSAVLIAKEAGVIAGLPVASCVYAQVDSSVVFQSVVNDGAAVDPGTRIATVRGPARSILEGERTALNFLQQLSGIATLAARFVRMASPHGVTIKDTRKTAPACREIQKYAARAGGCENHRTGLYDQILIKDNHLRCLPGQRTDAIRSAVTAAKEARPELAVEVETETLEEARAAAEAGADIIMLDNMPVEMIREAIDLIGARTEPRPTVEVSGGVSLETIEAIAATRPDWISVGAITHSAPALDISLEMET